MFIFELFCIFLRNFHHENMKEIGDVEKTLVF